MIMMTVVEVGDGRFLALILSAIIEELLTVTAGSGGYFHPQGIFCEEKSDWAGDILQELLHLY